MEIPVTVLVLFALVAGCFAPEPRFVEVQRDNIQECPVQAVCADTFTFTRTLEDGQRVAERRRVVNCHCPDSVDCPDERRNSLQASWRHKQQICENVRRTLRRCTTDMVAEQMRVDAEENGYRTYFKLLCRCPRHSRPVRGPGLQRATTLNAMRHVLNHYVHDYVCVRDDTRGRRRDMRSRRRIP